MAWTEPKVDWASPDGVDYTAINKIGANLVYLKTHVDATTGIHGAVSAATANKLILRDAAGRAKVVAPSAADDIALKSNVTALDESKVDVGGDTMTGPLIGDFPDTDYTTPMLRNIVLRETVPEAGDLENGEIAMVWG